jgi:CHAT domain
MLAEQQAAINRRFAIATKAESHGHLALALQLVDEVARDLDRQGEPRQYVWEWKARLQCGLARHTEAEQSLLLGRALAVRAGHRVGSFRMDLLRALNAIRAHQWTIAENLLAELQGDGAVMGDSSSARCADVARWLRELSFGTTSRNLSTLRVEVALVTAELWAARGKYRSALRLTATVHPDLAAANDEIDVHQVLLLEAEWLLAAGLLGGMETYLARIPAPATELNRMRITLTAARLAFARGRFAEALQLSESLVPVREDPNLFTSIIALQISILTELNLLQRAEAVATTAILRLGTSDTVRPFVELLQSATAGVKARGRSAMSIWELPFGKAEFPAASQSTFPPPASTLTPLSGSAGLRMSFAVTWTTAANQVTMAIERGDLEAAVALQFTLERITADVESESIAAHVRFSAILVKYYRDGPTSELVHELIGLATTFERIGVRLAAAQATRFASWACARLGLTDDHLALAHHASAIVEVIAGELNTAERLQFLMNKWNGRDELAAALMRTLLDPSRNGKASPSRRQVCRVYRRVDVLSHWPIDDALGVDGARDVGEATVDEVERWVELRLTARAGCAEWHPLRSYFGLWALPRRTLVLHYYALADRTYLFRIALGHIDLQVLPIGRIHLGSDAYQNFEHPGVLRDLSVRLGIAAAIGQFCRIDRLIIVPHDAIANIPFAALPVEGIPLCARVAISQLDRLSRMRRLRRFRPSTGPSVCVGLSSYSGSRYRDLPAAEVEALAVARLSPEPARVLLGEQASISNVMNALTYVGRLHVAAHGEFNLLRPEDSGIVLHEEGELRTLSLRELRRAKLRYVELVTLATCRSASHATLPGRERICLPTALLDAGARGVIGSLWPVDDQASLETMTELYRHLQSERPSVALARTQAAMRDRPIAHWAPLVFYGND